MNILMGGSGCEKVAAVLGYREPARTKPRIIGVPACRRAVAIIVRKRDRNWAVLDPQGQLVCLTVYKRGGVEVVRRLVAD